jgi:hypothetical protein
MKKPPHICYNVTGLFIMRFEGEKAVLLTTLGNVSWDLAHETLYKAEADWILSPTNECDSCG